MSPTGSSSDGSDRDVLGSLPRTRPQRRSAKRDRAVKAPASAGAAEPAAAQAAKAAATARKPAASKANPSRQVAAGAQPGAAKARARTAKAGPGAKAAAKPRAAAPKAAAGKVPPAGYAAPDGDGRRAEGGPADLIGTTIQAAGELAEIGATLAGQALRSALRRLPRP